MNPTTTLRRGLRVLALGAVLLAVTALVGVPRIARAQSAEGGEQEVRTQASGIGGYSVATSAAPVSILFYEPTIPIPTDPGDPNAEMSESHTQTDLSTGPRARAVASSIWPGAGVSGGWPQFTGGQTYPIMAEATYPGGQQEASQELPNGAGMHAVAKGLDVRADAKSQSTPSPELITFGNVSSTSISTVTEDGVAVARSDASLESVSLLGGLITIDTLRTRLEATSDGEKGATDGTTTISGLTIAGNGYVVEEGGVRPVQEGEASDGVVPVPSSLPGAEELREQLGIEVQAVPHDEEVEGARAVRRAGGVKITVDTGPLREALNVLPLGEIVGQTPDELKQQLYPILGLSPKIEYVLGRGSVYSTAALPLNLDLDVDIPPPAAAPPSAAPPASTSDSAFTTTPGGASSSGPSLGTGTAPAPQIAPEQSPQVAAPPTIATTPVQPVLFEGLPPGLVLLAAGLAALAAYGLRRLTAVFMPGGASGVCSDGAAKTVPQL